MARSFNIGIAKKNVHARVIYFQYLNNIIFYIKNHYSIQYCKLRTANEYFFEINSHIIQQLQ